VILAQLGDVPLHRWRRLEERVVDERAALLQVGNDEFEQRARLLLELLAAAADEVRLREGEVHRLERELRRHAVP
jgi:hypothetical protein